MWTRKSLWNPQRRQDGSSVRNVFEGSFTEGVTVSGKNIFEGGFKFASSDARDIFDSTDSAVQIEEYQSEFPYTQEYQNLEGK